MVRMGFNSPLAHPFDQQQRGLLRNICTQMHYPRSMAEEALHFTAGHYRLAIPAHIKRAVVARDGMLCRWCGCAVVRSATHRPDRLHFDHVKPYGAGGEHEVGNIVVACARCNLSRRKPRVSVRIPLAQMFGFSNGYYRWTQGTGYVPPQLLPPDQLALPLKDYAEERHREPLEVVLQIHRGRLAATPEGRILVEYHPGPVPSLREIQRRSRRASR